MSKELADWIVKNPSLAVALAIGLLSLVLAVLGLIVAQWLKPKIAELDALRTTVSELKTSIARGASAADKLSDIQTSIAVTQSSLSDLKAQGLQEEVGNLKGRIGTLETAKTGEQEVIALKLQRLEESVAEALRDLDSLQDRSEGEIVRIQAESAKTVEVIKRESRDELVRLSSIERTRLALEQAEQDLQLALIREVLARMNEARHPEALAKVQTAQARVEALRVQAQSLGLVTALPTDGA